MGKEMNQTKLIYLVLLLVVPLFSACQCTPNLSLKQIVESNNTLYINAQESKPSGFSIRTFDLENETWGKLEQKAYTILTDADGSIIVTSRGSVLRLNKEGKFSHVFDLSISAKPITADKDFFYLLKNKTPKNSKEARNKGLRYSKKESTFLKNHFEHNGNLIVSDVCEDNDFYWFICHDVALQIEFMQKEKRGYGWRPHGPLVIVSKSKEDGSIKEYQFNDQIWSRGQCLNGSEFIWLYAKTHKNFWDAYSGKHLIKFSKKSKKFILKSEKTFNSQLELFPNQYIADEEPHIWALDKGSQSVVKINTATMEREPTVLALPLDIKISAGKPLGWKSDVYYEFLYSDEKFLWLSAKKKKRYGIYFIPLQVPYLVRVSKNDMSYKLIKVKPTAPEAGRIFAKRYIVTTIIYPFAILLFVIAGLAGAA